MGYDVQQGLKVAEFGVGKIAVVVTVKLRHNPIIWSRPLLHKAAAGRKVNYTGVCPCVEYLHTLPALRAWRR